MIGILGFSFHVSTMHVLAAQGTVHAAKKSSMKYSATSVSTVSTSSVNVVSYDLDHTRTSDVFHCRALSCLLDEVTRWDLLALVVQLGSYLSLIGPSDVKSPSLTNLKLADPVVSWKTNVLPWCSCAIVQTVLDIMGLLVANDKASAEFQKIVVRSQ